MALLFSPMGRFNQIRSLLKIVAIMMKISVKSVHFHADAKLIEYVEEKLSRLNRYFSAGLISAPGVISSGLIVPPSAISPA